MNTIPCTKPHDHATSDDAPHCAHTQEREANEQPVVEEFDEKYDTSRMACTD